MSKYKLYDFDDIIIDETKKGKKIKSEDYFSNGLYPIIDQSQNEISGYSNNAEGLYVDVPAIIFGDHTRIIKYIDKPFFLGADGVKLLKSRIKTVSYKYLYYFFCYYRLPNMGYSRHFKWLKEAKIPLPPLEEQHKIASILDTVSEALKLRKQQLNELDLLVKSKFIEMFGDPVTNEKNWEIDKLGKLGELNRGVSKHRPRNDASLLNGAYPLIQTGEVSNTDLYIKSYKNTYSELGLKQSRLWKSGTLCITIAANIAQTSILTFDACFPDSIVGFNSYKKTNQIFIHFWFSFFQRILEEQAPYVAQKNINLKILNNLNVIVPPIELQNKFASFVEHVDELKSEVQKSIDQLQTLFDSLMQQYFE